MKKYETATKMISARITKRNLARLEKMSANLAKSKNELLNQAVEDMYEGHKINTMYLEYEKLGGDMTVWSEEILRYNYGGKNLAVSRLHHI